MGTISTLVDGALITLDQNGGTVTEANALHITNSGGSGTYTLKRGVYIGNLGTAETVDGIALDIEAQSGSSGLNFAIRNAGNSVQTGYARFGAVTAPTNVTAGDVTGTRLVFPEAALLTGVNQQFGGPVGIADEGVIRFYDDGNAAYVGIRAPVAAQSENYIIHLPDDDPNDEEVPTIDSISGSDIFLKWKAGGAGAAGATGPMGIPGFDGEDGYDGLPGPAGNQGATGATGATGAQGPMGPPGSGDGDGGDGESWFPPINSHHQLINLRAVELFANSKITIGNLTLSTPDTFFLNASDSTTPVLQFDTNDFLNYARTTDTNGQLGITINSVERLQLNDNQLNLFPTINANNAVVINGTTIGYTGHTATVFGSPLTIHDEGAGDRVNATLYRYSATAGQGATISFLRAKGSMAAPTAVASGDKLAQLNFLGYDGTDYAFGAAILAEVDGTVTGGGAADMPARLVFFTTADGSATPVERLRIKSDGGLTLPEQTAPATPTANFIVLYVKDKGTASALYYKDDDGDEFQVQRYDSKTITVESPLDTDDFVVETFQEAVTITEVNAVIVGSGTSVDIHPVHGTDRSAAGTALFSVAQTVDSKTSGEVFNTFANASIAAGSILRLIVDTLVGTITQLSVTFHYKITP